MKILRKANIFSFKSSIQTEAALFSPLTSGFQILSTNIYNKNKKQHIKNIYLEETRNENNIYFYLYSCLSFTIK